MPPASLAESDWLTAARPKNLAAVLRFRREFFGEQLVWRALKKVHAAEPFSCESGAV